MSQVQTQDLVDLARKLTIAERKARALCLKFLKARPAAELIVSPHRARELMSPEEKEASDHLSYLMQAEADAWYELELHDEEAYNKLWEEMYT